MDTRQCVSEDVGPRRWVDWEGPTSVPHRLERGTSTSEDAGPERGWIVRSHICWRGEQSIFIRVWKPLPSRRVLKTLRGSLEGKTQRGQYLIAVGLVPYKVKQKRDISC